MNIESIAIYFLAYIVTSAFGYFVVTEILKKFPLVDKGGFKGAGTVIGIIERIFILTFVLLGQYIAIGLILTAKSITRFEELKDRKFAEYYLIGTLSSMLFAMLIGIFTLWLLEIL